MAIKKKSRISKDPEKAKAQRASQFKKGHKKANGFGRPPMTEEEKVLSLKTRTQFKNIINKYMITSEEELKKLYQDKTIPILDGMIIKSLLNVYQSGNQSEINWFLNHSLGKEKETHNFNFSGSIDSMNPKDFTKEELLAMKAVHDARNKRLKS